MNWILAVLLLLLAACSREKFGAPPPVTTARVPLAAVYAPDGATVGMLPTVTDAGFVAKAPATVSTAGAAVDGGTFTVAAPTVAYGNDGGLVRTVEKTAATVGSASATLAYTVPPNTAGQVSAIIAAHRRGSSNLGGAGSWNCGVLAGASTCSEFAACAAASAWAASSDAGWSATFDFPDGGSCVATATVKGPPTVTWDGGSDAATVEWSAVIQYAGAR